MKKQSQNRFRLLSAIGFALVPILLMLVSGIIFNSNILGDISEALATVLLFASLFPGIIIIAPVFYMIELIGGEVFLISIDRFIDNIYYFGDMGGYYFILCWIASIVSMTIIGYWFGGKYYRNKFNVRS